jgi:outer membrane protein assembly factor BamA/autotransporter translocation and assembly factor TamB
MAGARKAAWWLAWGGFGLVGLVVVLGVAVHLPPVRAAVLAWAAARVEAATGVRLTAARLDYNLLTFAAGLEDLVVAAGEPDAAPFFTAARVDVTLDGAVLGGELRVAGLDVVDGRVTVVQAADGSSNLPAGGGDGGPPPALSIDRATLTGLAVTVDTPEVRLDVPRLDAEVTAMTGSVALGAPATLDVAGTRTVVSALEGDLAFDGRTVRVRDLQVTTDDVTATLDGRIDVLVAEPALALDVSANGDARRLARWAGLDPAYAPSGMVTVEMDARGAIATPTLDIVATVPRLAWRDIVLDAVEADARVDATGLDVESLTLATVGGSVRASGGLGFGALGRFDLEVAWADVDVAALLAQVAPTVPDLLGGMLTGAARAGGPVADVTAWDVDLSLGVAAPAAAGLAWPGTTRLTLADGAWTIDGTHRVANAVPAEISVAGVIVPGDWRRSTLGGTIDVPDTAMGAVVDALVAAGMITDAAGLDVSGRVAARARLAGTLGTPRLEAEAELTSLTSPTLQAARVLLGAAGTPSSEGPLTFTLASDRVVAAGQALASLDVAGQFAGGVVTLDHARAAQPGAPGRLDLAGTYRVADGTYDVAGAVTAWALVPSETLPMAGTVEARVAGRGAVATPAGEVTLAVAGARWAGLDLGRLDASVAAAGGTARLTAAVPAFGVTAEGLVVTAAPWDAVVDVTADAADLARLAAGFELPATLAGAVDLDVHAEGPLDDWRAATVTAEVARLDARVNDVRVVLTAPAALRYAGTRLEIATLAAQAGALRVTVTGTMALGDVPSDGPPLALSVAGQTADLLDLAEAFEVTDLPPVEADGPVRVDLRVAGTLAAPDLTGDVIIGPGPVRFADLPALEAVEARARLEAGRLTLVQAGGTYQGARVAATGDAPLSLFGVRTLAGAPVPAPASLSLRLTGVTSRVLETVLEPDVLVRMAGVADLSVDLASPSLDPADVTGALVLDRFLVAVSGVPIRQAAPTRLVAEGGRLRVDTWDWTGDGAELTVSGAVDLSARAFDLTTDGTLDLRLLAPFLREAGVAPRGSLRPQLSLTGTFEAPDVAGTLTLDGGELQVASPRVLVSDLSLQAVLSRPMLEVVSLYGQVNGGRLTGGGRLSLDPGNGASGQLALSVGGMALELPEGLRSEVDADLALRLTGGTGATPLGGAIEGRVVVVRGAYREQLSAIGSLLGALNDAGGVVAVDATPGFADRVALDVALVTEEDLVVDNNYGELLLGADLRVLGTAGAPTLSGRAEIREGGRLFVGPNTYTITQGTIDFANPVQIEPSFGIVATTRAGSEDIQVTIAGTPADLTIDPVSTSRPELSRTDVQALLLTGRTFDQLSSADAASLGVQLAGSFSGDVLGVAGRAVGLDTLRLDADVPGQVGDGAAIGTVASLGPDADTSFRLPGDSTTLATEADPTSRLTFGKALAPNLDLIFSQNLIVGDAQTWILDYQPFRRVDLRFVSDDDSLRAYSLRHDVAFGERTPASTTARREEPRVVAVRIDGSLALPETEVRGVLGLAPGDRFGFPEWLDDRDALDDLYARRGYLIAEISATRVAPEAGVTLTYVITAGPRTVVRVSGRALGRDIVEAIEAAWRETVSEGFLVEEVETLVLAALAAEGDFGAAVRVSLADEGDSRVLSVAVEGGRAAGALRPRVTGGNDPTNAAVTSRLGALPLASLSVADRDGLADAVAAYLRTRGHLRATAAVDPVVVDAGGAVLPVRLQPGPVFRVGTVTLEGAGVLPAEDVRAAVALAPGDLHDATRTAQARDAVAGTYRNEGFPQAAVVAREQVREDALLVDVTLVVTPGPREILLAIEVRGNEEISETAVIEALRLPLGSPLRTEEWLAARIRLFETELFRRVDLTTEVLEAEAGPDVRPVRAVVEVEEWPALRLRYGFEVAEERPIDGVDGRDLVPGVRADLIRRTLLGRAINVGTTLQLQRREQTGRVFLRTPTLLGLPLESQVVVRGAREEIVNVSLERFVAGVTWEQRHRFSPDVLVSYSYDFERNRTFDTDPLPGEPVFDVSVNVAKLRANASWDTRDDPSDTGRGHLLTTSVEFTPESLGSEISYLRSLSQAYWFRPWGAIVLASAGRVGAIGALGDQPLLTGDRFFAGGARSLRGVAENALGERDFFGDPAGGELLLLLNQEVRFPLYRWVRGVVFLDAGNVFATRGDFRLRGLTGAGGVGLRLDTPFGLFRVDVGKQIWNAGDDPGARVTFGIGQAF